MGKGHTSSTGPHFTALKLTHPANLHLKWFGLHSATETNISLLHIWPKKEIHSLLLSIPICVKQELEAEVYIFFMSFSVQKYVFI